MDEDPSCPRDIPQLKTGSEEWIPLASAYSVASSLWMDTHVLLSDWCLHGTFFTTQHVQGMETEESRFIFKDWFVNSITFLKKKKLIPHKLFMQLNQNKSN